MRTGLDDELRAASAAGKDKRGAAGAFPQLTGAPGCASAVMTGDTRMGMSNSSAYRRSRDRALAIAAPMPHAAPVTTATLSVKLAMPSLRNSC